MPITNQALVQRIQRKVSADGKTLHEARGGRGSRWYNDLGLYYSGDSHNHVC